MEEINDSIRNEIETLSGFINDPYDTDIQSLAEVTARINNPNLRRENDFFEYASRVNLIATSQDSGIGSTSISNIDSFVRHVNNVYNMYIQSNNRYLQRITDALFMGTMDAAISIQDHNIQDMTNNGVSQENIRRENQNLRRFRAIRENMSNNSYQHSLGGAINAGKGGCCLLI